MTTLSLKLSDLAASTNASPPPGWKVPTGLFNSPSNVGIDSSGFYAATNSWFAAWVNDVPLPTTKPIRAEIIQRSSASSETLSLQTIGAGLIFCNTENTKAIIIIFKGNSSSGLGFLSVFTITNSVIEHTPVNYPLPLQVAPADLKIIAVYEPSTGIVSVSAEHALLAEGANKTKFSVEFPSHTNFGHAGVFSSRLLFRLSDLVIENTFTTATNGVTTSAIETNRPAIDQETFSVTCTEGFEPKYGSIYGAPVEVTHDVGNVFTITQKPFDYYLGSSVNPFTGSHTGVPNPNITEDFCEFISDEVVSRAFIPRTTAGYPFSDINTLPNPNLSDPRLLQNVYTYIGAFRFIGAYVTTGSEEWHITLDPITGIVGLGRVGNTTTDYTGDGYFYTYYHTGDYLRKFKLTSVNSVVTALEEVTEQIKPFFNKLNAEYSTFYETNEFTVDTAGSISIDSGEYAIDTGSGYGAWTSTAGTVAVGDKVKLKNRSKQFKDRTTVTNVTISGTTYEWLIRNKLDKQYEMDLSLPNEEQIVRFTGFMNDIPLSTDRVRVVSVEPIIAGTKNTRVVVNGTGSFPYQGEVELEYNRVNLSGFGAYKTPDLLLDTLTPTNTMIVDKFNALYGTALDVDDFLFPTNITTPDRDGEVYTVWSALDNLVYTGSLSINVKTNNLVPEISYVDFSNELTFSSAYGSGARLGNEMIIAGALKLPGDGVRNRECHVFNMLTKQWTQVADSPVHNGSSMVTNGTDVYLCSGWHIPGVNPGIFKLNASDYTWTRITGIPFGPASSDGANTVAYGMLALSEDSQYLHFMGGATGVAPNTVLGDHWRYHIASNTWTELAPMPQAMWRSSVQFYGGKLYLVGGSLVRTNVYESVNNVFCYDPATNQWTEKSSLPVHIQGTNLQIVDGLLLAYSGNMLGTANKVFKGVQVYNFATDKWVKFERSDVPGRSFGHSCVYAGNMYVFGGDRTGGASSYTSGITKINVHDFYPVPLTGAYTTLAAGPNQSRTSAGVIGDKMYVPGGWSDNGVETPALNIYDFLTNTWSTGSEVGLIGHKPSVDVVGEKLYVFGGDRSGTADLSMKVYTPGTNSWANLTTPFTGDDKQGMASVAVGDYIYYCSGLIGTVYTTEFWRYDTVNNTWLELENFPLANGVGVMVHIDGKLYCHGGYDWNGGVPGVHNKLYAYDIALDSWEQLTSSGVNRQIHSAVVYNDKMYVYGGGDGAGARSNTLEMYDPVTDTWSVIGEILTGRLGTPMVVRNQNIYIFGGDDAFVARFTDLIKVS